MRYQAALLPDAAATRRKCGHAQCYKWRMGTMVGPEGLEPPTKPL
jgi:hypothetical protein